MTTFTLVPQYVQRELRNCLHLCYPKLREARIVIFYEEGDEQDVHFYAKVEFTLGDTFVSSSFRYLETRRVEGCEFGWHCLHDEPS